MAKEKRPRTLLCMHDSLSALCPYTIIQGGICSPLVLEAVQIKTFLCERWVCTPMRRKSGRAGEHQEEKEWVLTFHDNCDCGCGVHTPVVDCMASPRRVGWSPKLQYLFM